MKIVKIVIKNFRCIKSAEIYPHTQNVFLGPNNIGKTTILEALNLVLNPELARQDVIDENDFYKRAYSFASETEPAQPAPPQPHIYIEVVLSDLDSNDEDHFVEKLVPWVEENRQIIESTEEGVDPFAGAKTAIRVFFEGWYDPIEDDFDFTTRFLRSAGMRIDDCPRFTKEDKRYIGFLIYRDFRALTRPITIEQSSLFSRLLFSQLVVPKNFESVLQGAQNALDPMVNEPDFKGILGAFQEELEKFLNLSDADAELSFDLTDRTRKQVKANAQMYVNDGVMLPIQKMGAGTRSLIILSMLTLIMRRRKRGILALEEPETFLFPHAQRRVIDECLALATQTFITTHSPYVLERIPVEGVGRLVKKEDDDYEWKPLSTDNLKSVKLYTQRLRKVHCEALVGKAAMILEGDSDKCWLMGASRILNGKSINGIPFEALELQGISIISADTNGDIIKLGNFFLAAGLNVVGVFDRVDDAGLLKEVMDAAFPSLFIRQKGLEDVLSEGLPIDILKKFLMEAPHCKGRVFSTSEIQGLTDEDIRKASSEKLEDNKGALSMHEWLIEQVDESSLPASLVNLVFLSSQILNNRVNITTCSLIK